MGRGIVTASLWAVLLGLGGISIVSTGEGDPALEGFTVRGDTILIGATANKTATEGADAGSEAVPSVSTPPKQSQSAIDRLIKWVQIEFVDVNFGKGSGGRGKKDQSNKPSFSAGRGSGAGGSTLKSRDGRVGFDDSTSKNTKAGDFPGVDNKKEDEDETPPPGGKGSSSNGESQAFGLWYPMCLFMGESVSQAGGNATVKAMVDEFAQKCAVNLVVFPVAVVGLPAGAPGAVNAWQTSVCNAAEALGVRQASTSTCVNDAVSADIMCNSWIQPGVPTTSVAGCAGLGGPPGESARIQQLYNSLQQQGLANGPLLTGQTGGGGGGAVASIEDVGSCDSGTVNHEAIGHSMMGWGHGPEAGYGIGFSGGGGGGGGWTGVGCAAIQASAFPNDGRYRWNPNQQTYFVQPTDMSLWKQFGDMTPLFGGLKPPPNGGPPILGDNPQQGGDANNADPRPVVVKDPTKPPDAPVNNKGVSVAVDTTSKHKKKPRPAKSPEELLAGLREESMGSAPEDRSLPATVKPPEPPTPGRGKEGGRVKFDDNAAKVRVGSGGSTGLSEKKVAGGPPAAKPGSVPSAASSTGGSRIYGDSVDFHEGPPPLAVGAPSPPPSSGTAVGGGTVKFDDSRAKGANLKGGALSTGEFSKTPGSFDDAPAPPWYADEGAGAGLLSSGAIGQPGFNGNFFNDVGKIIDEEEEEQMRRYKGQLKRRPASLKDKRVRGVRENSSGSNAGTKR